MYFGREDETISEGLQGFMVMGIAGFSVVELTTRLLDDQVDSSFWYVAADIFFKIFEILSIAILLVSSVMFISCAFIKIISKFSVSITFNTFKSIHTSFVWCIFKIFALLSMLFLFSGGTHRYASIYTVIIIFLSVNNYVSYCYARVNFYRILLACVEMRVVLMGVAFGSVVALDLLNPSSEGPGAASLFAAALSYGTVILSYRLFAVSAMRRRD